MIQENELKLLQEIERLKRQVERLKVGEMPTGGFVPLTTPLTSTAWDGDSFSTTAKTKIDLSDVFGAPAGIKAILAKVTARDSGSAGATMLYFGISPIETSAVSPVVAWVAGTTNNSYQGQCGICPCDANGDIYYQIEASGKNTMDCWLEIWGYWL